MKAQSKCQQLRRLNQAMICNLCFSDSLSLPCKAEQKACSPLSYHVKPQGHCQQKKNTGSSVNKASARQEVEKMRLPQLKADSKSARSQSTDKQG